MLLDYARYVAFQMMMATLVLGGGFGLMCALYVVKSVVGIDIMEGHSFMHDLFY